MRWRGQRPTLGQLARPLPPGLSAAAIVVSLLLAAPAAHASITIGSPLSGFFSTATCGNAGGCTRANTALGDPGALVISPVSGLVVRWRLAGNYGGTFKLRVLRPVGGGQYRGVGTSAPVSASGTATLTLAASLPIEPGDLVGVDYGSGHHLSDAMVSGSAFGEWAPPLADGDTAPPTPFGTSNLELLYNADVEPSSSFTVGKPVLNKRKGTATLTLNLPNPGELAGSGNGAIVASAAGARISKAVSAGPAQLLVKAKGKKKRKLNEKGKVKLNVAVTYTPTNGTPATQSLKVKLKKKL